MYINYFVIKVGGEVVISNYVSLVHFAGLCYLSDSLLIFRRIIMEGLRSRQSLVDLGSIPKMSVDGVFSDEHKNIYFVPEFFVKEKIPGFYKKCSNSIFIKANSESLYVYNMEYRGDVSIFEYESSKTFAVDFIERIEDTQKLKSKISAIGDVLKVVTHPLTGVAVMVYKETYDLLDRFKIEAIDFMPEVVVSLDHIGSSYFYTTGHGSLYNNTLKDDSINEDAHVIEAQDQTSSRKIFLNEDGTDLYRPSKFRLGDSFGNIELSDSIKQRYDCVMNVQKVFLSELSLGNISFSYKKKQICQEDFNSVICSSKAYHKVIFGDARDNSITFDPFSLYHVIGGKGADQYMFVNSYANKVILDFDGAEGDRMHLPDYLYKTPEEAVGALYHNNGMAILPIGDLGSVILPDLVADIRPEDIVIY